MNKQIINTILAVLVVLMLVVPSVSALTISDVSSSPSELEPGETVSLSLTVENEADIDAENVVVALDLSGVPFAPYQSSNEQTLEEIKDGDEEDIEFKLIVDSDADSGTYKIPVKMSYTIDEEDKTNEGIISLIINAKPDIQASLDTEEVLIKGKNNELKIKVVNSGLGNARLLSVKIPSVVGVKIVSSDTVYVGDIDSDDFDTVEFGVFINEKAPSIITVPLTIKYRDSRNEEITEVKNIELRTYTTQEAIQLGLIKESNVGLIVGVIIGVVVLIFIYRFIKKRRRRKKKE